MSNHKFIFKETPTKFKYTIYNYTSKMLRDLKPHTKKIISKRITVKSAKISHNRVKKRKDVILLNFVRENLPYISIPQINANFLIDTGNSRSSMDPALAKKIQKIYLQ